MQHAPHRLRDSKEDLKKRPPRRLVRNIREVSRRRQRRRLIVILGIFFFACFVMGVVIYDHYRTYPAIMERDSIYATDRGSDYIALAWNKVRNAAKYKVYVKEHFQKEAELKTREIQIDDSWMEYDSDTESIKVEGLEEGSSYSFVIRPDSEVAEGLYTTVRNFRTKKSQSIELTQKVTKLTCSKPFKLAATAETELVYESDNPEVAEVLDSGEINIIGKGNAEIRVHAKETDEYEQNSAVVELQVLDATPVRAGGAKARNIYHLDSENCEVVKKITGSGGAVIPQSFGYTGDQYIVAFGMGSPNRIISFDVKGKGKEVSVPKVSMGHPNGFAYADENKTCYCVKGWTSRAVTYKPETGEYGVMNFAYGCSGVAYDRKEKLLYTSSRTLMAAYSISDGYSVVNTAGVVSHSGSLETQDIGGHGGIMLRCLSPSGNKHGTNYIDLYDMRNSTYLGTLSCDLSEVESAVVNKDGFLEILANNSGSPDYIWRTDINIETLAEGIKEPE